MYWYIPKVYVTVILNFKSLLKYRRKIKKKKKLMWVVKSACMIIKIEKQNVNLSEHCRLSFGTVSESEGEEDLHRCGLGWRWYWWQEKLHPGWETQIQQVQQKICQRAYGER